MYPNAVYGEYIKKFQSFDYMKRISISDLSALCFEHMCTVEDFGIYKEAVDVYGLNVWAAGYTEWKGESQGLVVSLAWDWFARPGENPSVFPVVSPRTNLRLIDTKGYDMADAENNKHLLQIVERLDWRRHVTPLPYELASGLAAPLLTHNRPL